MTTAYVTDHAALEACLVSWFETYAGFVKNRVTWLNQVSNRPPKPYGNIQIIADSNVEGQDAELQRFNTATGFVERVTYGPRRMSVQFTIYTYAETDVGQQNARNRLNGLVASLRSQRVKDQFRAAGLAFHQALGGLRILDEQLGQRWERRAQIDLEFGYMSLFTDKPAAEDAANWVEQVEPITEAAGTLQLQE